MRSKTGPDADFTADVDMPAQKPDQLVRNDQTDPGTLYLCRFSAKPVANPLFALYPEIGRRHRKPALLRGRNRQGYLTVRAIVFDGV